MRARATHSRVTSRHILPATYPNRNVCQHDLVLCGVASENHLKKKFVVICRVSVDPPIPPRLILLQSRWKPKIPRARFRRTRHNPSPFSKLMWGEILNEGTTLFVLSE